MKSVCYIAIFAFVLSCFQDMTAQTRTRPRPGQQEQQSSGLPELSVRAKSKNEDQTKGMGNVPWVREIYRTINLNDAENAPLYYPVEPIGDRMNLFTIIFKLMLDDKLDAYEYLGSREIFTDKYKINFKETMDRFQVFYTEEKSGAATRYIVDESDIPSSDVLSYLIKEAWYFDPANSSFDVKLLAICPILIREGDFGDLARMPMFWLPYENIRPYILQEPVMTSNINNAMTYTLDDYFRKRMFKGDIIKTTNLLNHTLVQQFGDNPDTLKMAQDSIEKQLKLFEEKLWLPKDTTSVADKGKKNKKDKKEKSTEPKGERKARKSEPKQESTSSAPARSVRRTR